MKKNIIISIILFVVLFIAAASVCASPIIYEVINLIDTKIDEDLWKYNYYVKNFIFQEGNKFTIYFDGSQYQPLEALVTIPEGDSALWEAGESLVILESDLEDTFGDDWPSEFGYFMVTTQFVWLGNGVPGSQTFEIYSPDYLKSGYTAPIPEPSSLLLLGTGLLGMLGYGGVKFNVKKEKR